MNALMFHPSRSVVEEDTTMEGQKREWGFFHLNTHTHGLTLIVSSEIAPARSTSFFRCIGVVRRLEIRQRVENIILLEVLLCALTGLRVSKSEEGGEVQKNPRNFSASQSAVQNLNGAQEDGSRSFLFLHAFFLFR